MGVTDATPELGNLFILVFYDHPKKKQMKAHCPVLQVVYLDVIFAD